MKKAKIGLILDDKLQSWNIKDLIEKSLESNVYEISCIIVQKNISITNSSFIKKINCRFASSSLSKKLKLDEKQWN